MNQMKKNRINRVLSILLMAVLVITMLPTGTLQAFSATTNHPDIFTFTVTDMDGVIEGASVKLYNDTLGDASFEWVVNTDANGEAAFAEFSALSSANMQITVYYTVTAENHEDISSTMEVTDFTQNVAVTMSKTVTKNTITVSKTGEGTVTINGNEAESQAVENGSAIKLEAKANTGYQISSLTLGGTAVADASGKSEYSVDMVVTADMAITVTFVQVYTVTVKHTGNGTINITPAAVGGVVTVEPGTAVEINAIPDANYHVSSVTINDVADETVSGANDSGYNKTITTDGEYTVEITFAPNVYNINIESPVNGSVTVENTAVEYAKGTRVNIVPNEGYTLASVTVNDTPLTSIIKDASGIYFLLENISAEQKVNVTFKEISNASEADVNIHSAAALRKNTENTLFVIKTGSAIDFSTEKAGIKLYNANGILGGGEGVQSVSVSDTTTIEKISLYYQADGDFYAEWHDVNMEAKNIVVDTQKTSSVLMPTSNPNAYGYYNSNVTLSATVEEQGEYSGIAKVEYWITYDTVSTDSVTIYEYTGGEIKSLYANTQDIVVDATLYNGNSVKVTLKVTDLADNEEFVEQVLNINSTRPTVSVSMSGVQNPDALEGYYDDERMATITIVDREDTFSETAVLAGIEILADGNRWELEAEDIEWEHNGSTHIGKWKFSDDAEYSWRISYTNLAGMTNENVIEEGENVFAFTVDKADPYDLKITYSQSVVDVVLENITYGNLAHKFYDAPVTVMIEAADTTSGIQKLTYSYTGAEETVIESDALDTQNSISCTSFTISPQFVGQVSFTAIDKAGRSVTLSDNAKVVVVDEIAPGIKVLYDNNEVVNGKYFKTGRIATVEIDEDNYFAEDMVDFVPGKTEEYLVITEEKTFNDGTYKETKLKPEFKFSEEEGVYKADIVFDEDADYTFDIKYTDRSGNVYDGYTKDEFTVDKTAPKLSVEYLDVKEPCYTDRIAKITVEEHNFNLDDAIFSVEATDITGKTINLDEKDYIGFLKNEENWTQTGDIWTTQILLDIEGIYTFTMEYVDMAGNPQKEVVNETFCIDKSMPEISDNAITYNTSVLDTILNQISYGFYKDTVRVEITAMDDYSGVDYFLYSYTVEDGASTSNQGAGNVKIDSSQIIYDGNKATATFEIPAQFRGKVSFEVFDKAGHRKVRNALPKDPLVIVDNVAPGVTVTYDNNNAKYENYYVADRTATITITEANFFAEDLAEEYLVITVGKTLNNGSSTTTCVKPTFTKNGDEYIATVKFDENADYTFDIKYTDRSGNVYDSYPADVFTVDKIQPEIDINYDNNICKNGNKFDANRVATITVTEHNFHAADIKAVVTANGTVKDKYTAHLVKDASWTHNGDVHTAQIAYIDEVNYTFQMTYADMAGNTNTAVRYGNSVAPEVFTIDKTAPTNLTIKIAGESVIGKNSIAFDTFYDKKVTVKLTANGGISGIQSLQYQKVADASKYDVNGTWKAYDSKKGIVVSPSEKFIIYFRAEDKSGNVTIVNSTGIVVDNKKPVGETNAPEIDIIPAAANENGMYSGNVAVNLKVVEPKYSGKKKNDKGYYSGLNKVTYKIFTTDTEAVEEGILFDAVEKKKGAKFDKDKLAKSWSGKITVDSTKFNSNLVYVQITATDNAGNTRTSTTEKGDISIDITAPAIEVTYSNNDADSDSYFMSERVATIVITERNFKADDVKLTISNADGAAPAVGTWSKSTGGANGDDTRWTADIAYTEDGDYEFDIEYTDLAGNIAKEPEYGDSIAPTEFTIDQTEPTVDVTYDNNNTSNGNYYNEARVATITITEHNLEPNGADGERIVITTTASDDGASATASNISSWSTSGDKHTATITFSEDALHSFDIDVKDKAGNEAVDFEQQSFYVDTTEPAIEISGVKNYSANKGVVMPVVSCSDTNMDAKQLVITLTGANRKKVKLDGSYANIHNGRVFTFKNFAKEKVVDDIYTLTASLTDMAGNTTTEEIVFSVNRFGSTYALSDDTEEVNDSYVQNSQDVVVIETNVNKLKNIKVTLFKNNETIMLAKDADYKLDISGGNGQWYKYTYTIFKKNFADDGVYRVALHSEDAAGNMAENTLDTKDKEISFGVDKTKPDIVVTNLEDGKTYDLENMIVSMSVKDNLLLNTAKVYLDDFNKAYKTWEAEEITDIIGANGDFTFEIPGTSTRAHTVKIVCVDAAGNEKVEEIRDFFVTTNQFVRFYNNKVLFFGTVAGILALAVLLVFIVVYKKKKNGKNSISV